MCEPEIGSGRIDCCEPRRGAAAVFVTLWVHTHSLQIIFKTNGNDRSESSNLFDFGSLTLVLLMAANDFIVRDDECSELCGYLALPSSLLKINFKQVAGIRNPLLIGFCGVASRI